MIVRVVFVALLFLAMFYGLIQLALSSPLAKVRAAAWAVIKRVSLFALAAVLTGVVMGLISTVDHIF